MRVAIRTDASLAIGTGHVMRCLTLATQLREQGAEVRFVCRAHEGNLNPLIAARGFAVAVLPAPQAAAQPGHAGWLGVPVATDAAQTGSALGDATDWLVTDHYAIDREWHSALRSSVTRIFAIDDLADRRHDCDMLLDQNLSDQGAARYDGLVPRACTVLASPHYALLQPDYAPLHATSSPREGAVKRILVFFGGVDRDSLTLRTLQALLALPGEALQIDVVPGGSNPDRARIEALAAGMERVTVHGQLPSLAPLMMQADLAIGAGGAVSWERLCLGLPSIVVTVAENQRTVAGLLSQRGLIDWLGDAAELSDQQLAAALAHWRKDGIPAGWFPDHAGLVDGAGAARVASAMMNAAVLEPLGAGHE